MHGNNLDKATRSFIIEFCTNICDYFGCCEAREGCDKGINICEKAKKYEVKLTNLIKSQGDEGCCEDGRWEG